jgi:transcriptional regulator with XRE-family HTH domain
MVTTSAMPMACDEHATIVRVDDETETARKLRALLEHLEITASEFARRTGVSQAYLSKIKNGDRGGGPGKSLALRVAARDTFGVPDIYWLPGDSFDLSRLPKSGKVGSSMNVAAYQQIQQHDDFRRQLAQVAAELGDPPDVVVALLRETPPPGADLIWWVRRYRELLDAHTHTSDSSRPRRK